MSIAEIKSEARTLSADEVRHLAAYFHHVARSRDGGYAAGLDKAWAEMEAGDKVSLDEVKRLDEQLRAARL